VRAKAAIAIGLPTSASAQSGSLARLKYPKWSALIDRNSCSIAPVDSLSRSDLIAGTNVRNLSGVQGDTLKTIRNCFPSFGVI
jgi:hypothetical protein